MGTSGRKKCKKLTEVQQLRKKLSRCQHALKKERARWDEKCPQGHLRRHDKCELMCLFTNIDPTVDMPKPVPNSILHDWVVDDLPQPLGNHVEDWAAEARRLFAQYEVDSAGLIEKKTGWWIRIPLAWWLSFKKWLTPPEYR